MLGKIDVKLWTANFLLCRALEEKRARLGLVARVNHDLLQPCPVLHEKPGVL